MKHFFTKNRLITLVSVLVILLLWKGLSLWMASSLLLPSPEESLITLVKLVSKPHFFPGLGSTVGRGLTGFILAFIPGLWLGIWAGAKPGVHAALKPLIVSIRSTPVISFILLALIWFHVNQVPIFIAFLTMFPIVYTNTVDGIRYIDREFVEMARVYRVQRRRIVREVYLPAIAPYLLSGASSAMGFGWRAVIIGEVLSQPRYGIGTQMQHAQTYLLVSELIAWTVIAVLVSYLFETIIRHLERRFVHWK
jgi:NitT/TauT family transport system permease protein